MSSKELSIFERRMMVSIVLAASFLSVLMQFLLITAFPKIMAEFQIDASKVQWLTTSYMLAIAVLIPMTAYLIDTFKSRTLMITAMFLFTVGTLVGLFSTNFGMLLAGRMIQGIGSGILMPLMQTILLLVYPQEKRGYAMGLAGLVINVAPAVGPPISGFILNFYDWRTLYIVTLPIAALILLFTYFYMRNVTEQRETKIDILSILLSSIGFGGILYGINTLQLNSGKILLMIGVFALTFFVVRQFRLKIPILDLRVMKVPMFALVTIISILSFSLLISIETIVPLYVQKAQQYTPLHSGFVVAPGALTLAFMSLFAGNLYDKYGGKVIAIIGFVLLNISTLTSYYFLDLSTSLIFTAILFILSMAGVALINMPLMTAGINALPNSLIAHGTSVINTARQFGGSLGLTFIISFMSTDSANVAPTTFLTGVKTSFFAAFLFAITGLVLSFLLKKEK